MSGNPPDCCFPLPLPFADRRLEEEPLFRLDDADDRLERLLLPLLRLSREGEPLPSSALAAATSWRNSPRFETPMDLKMDPTVGKLVSSVPRMTRAVSEGGVGGASSN